MNKLYRVLPEQVVNLHNNLIISEALEDDTADDYNDLAMSNVNKEANNPPPTEEEGKESTIYGDITKILYNYSQTYGVAAKVATEIGALNKDIEVPMARQFIEKLLYGIYKMASDPTQIEAFERLMLSIGVTLNAEIITKDDQL